MSGYKLVPVEPTKEMLDAHFAHLDVEAQDVYPHQYELAKGAYAAMLEASPAASYPASIPPEVLNALDRMCTPLDASVLSGATAEADAHSMRVIRDYVMATASPISTSVETVIQIARKYAAARWQAGFSRAIGEDEVEDDRESEADAHLEDLRVRLTNKNSSPCG